ncbi:hypothetical protein SAMN05216456_2187 [Devosia crocina]|uniref:Uncharacterized protein n=1 Tax=Devosia crocina TaxID=429728 RepID=A0A1I7NLR3_9HYPH|nr:hypothetical protein SAMN05216456_2187 [Devosia crocina]
MVFPLHLGVRPQNSTEHVQFGAAKSLACGCSGTDRAVVFNEEQRAIRLFVPACHIAFGAAQIGKGRHAITHPLTFCNCSLVVFARHGFAGCDDGVERLVPQVLPDQVEQLQRQTGMGIGEPCLTRLRQPPGLARPPDPLRNRLRFDQAFLSKAQQLLARSLAADPEFPPEPCRRHPRLHLERHQRALGRIAGRPAGIFRACA